jgi:hypothetical protein
VTVSLGLTTNHYLRVRPYKYLLDWVVNIRDSEVVRSTGRPTQKVKHRTDHRSITITQFEASN